MNARMNHKLSWAIVVAMLAAGSRFASAATTIVECIGRDGTTSYNAFCPPGSTKRAEHRYQPIHSAAGPSSADLPQVTLFSVADCDACDLVRNVLNTRDIPYSEKNVSDNKEFQDELRGVADGSLSVPTVLIGETSLRGYNRSAIENALNQAGYPTPAKEETQASE